MKHTLQGTVLIVRVTQQLVNDGYKFIDNSRGDIKRVIDNNGESIYFGTPTELKNWIYSKAEDY